MMGELPRNAARAMSLPEGQPMFLRALKEPARQGVQVQSPDEQDARRIRAAQIDAVVHIAPLTLSINLVNAAIIGCVFWNTGSNTFLTSWGALLTLVVSLGIFSWRRTRTIRP